MPILDAAWVPGDNARRLRSEQAEEPQENEDEGYGGYAQLFEGINNEDNKDEEDHKYEEIPDPHSGCRPTIILSREADRSPSGEGQGGAAAATAALGAAPGGTSKREVSSRIISDCILEGGGGVTRH